ncbi:17843_t:CDS:2, partial [Gigaspora margarita]
MIQWSVVQPIFANIKKIEFTNAEENRVKGIIRSKTIDIYQAMGENVGDEIVDECQQSLKRLNKDKKGQSRSRSGADYHADSRDNVESQEPVSVSEDDDSDVADLEGDKQSDQSGEEKQGPFRLSKENREEVVTAFKSMDERCMWKLLTGRFVEKELYKLGQELEFEQLIDDELISSHFNDTELDKIDYATGPHVPDLSDQIAEFLYDFVGKSSRNSRQDNERHAWFNCHIWKVIFDQAFKNIDVISVVSFLKKYEKKLEVFGRMITEPSSLRRWVLKLPKALKDMLVMLTRKVDWNREKCVKIQMVGIIHAEFDVTKMMEVPDNPENFSSVLKKIASVLNLK